MDCGGWREALSARLDGEESPGAAVLDTHLAGCSDCRRWYDDAAALTRVARIGLAVPAQPVSDTVLDVTPSSTRSSMVRWLRLALAVLGGVQALVGVAQMAGTLDSQMGTTAVEGATPSHLMHESAAWNLAIGAAYLFIAWRRTRPAAVIPILTAFVGMLTLLSLGDMLDGAVAASRLVSHAPVLLGYAIVVIMSRPSMSFDRPSGERRSARRRWRLDQRRLGDVSDAPVTLPTAARHDSPAASVASRRAA